jgi:hypothetical protein
MCWGSSSRMSPPFGVCHETCMSGSHYDCITLQMSLHPSLHYRSHYTIHYNTKVITPFISLQKSLHHSLLFKSYYTVHCCTENITPFNYDQLIISIHIKIYAVNITDNCLADVKSFGRNNFIGWAIETNDFYKLRKPSSF